MSAGISRQQMVTVCLLNFSTAPLKVAHLDRTNSHHAEGKQTNSRPPCSHIAPQQEQVLYAACMHKFHTHAHTHTRTNTQWQKPACIDHDISPVSCSWERNCGWQIDWKIILPLSSIISACLSSSCCSIHLLEREGKPLRPALTIKSPTAVSEKHSWGPGIATLTESKRFYHYFGFN